MIRRTALAIALCATACAPADQPPDAPSAEELAQANQSLESLDSPSEENAIRFLEQATFGPRLANGTSPVPIDTVEYVTQYGIRNIITEQIYAPRSEFDGSDTSPNLGAQFFYNVVTGKDQLRQRVAFALSQILVISQSGIPNPASTPTIDESKPPMAAYLNLLSRSAFGNFRYLLKEIAMDPAMGVYLDMVNNRAFDTTGARIEPNENFARELLQLFTVGLYMLDDGGVVQKDGLGQPIPAYTEAHVQAFAHALSGWTYYSPNGCPGMGRSNPVNYTAPMIPCDVNHDSRSQPLFAPDWTTEGGTAQQHLDQAIASIYKHPNVAPFICKQLIQHLVTSNPSPDYVRDVVYIFRLTDGDLGAVVRAILEHAEARGPMAPLASYAVYGHLRSPALFITSLLRGLNVTLDTTNGKNPGEKLRAWSALLGQNVPRPPTVFSYYPPSSPAPGSSTLVGPEFAILDTATVIARANVVNELLYKSAPANNGVLIDLSVLPADETDLVLWLNRYWLHDTMSPSLQAAVYGAIADPRASTVLHKKKVAVFLTSLSPEFQIQR
jgi:uncharacterized protein (DUF1800 family)